MQLLVFLITFMASSFGSVAGFGGGVIIKPTLDAFGILPVSTVSFLSGCTALGMAVSSLITQKNNGVRLHVRTSTPLALGAILGGFAGKTLFEFVRTIFGNESILGGIQAVCLTVITTCVLLYICGKDHLKSFHVANPGACVAIGILLGIISSFLGIGGGTSNVMILFLCFSMDAKTAAKNSLYIIIFSQSASILQAVLTSTVPTFELGYLLLMLLGGITGAITGATVSRRLSNRGVERILRTLLVIIILIDISNVIKFFL